MTTLFEKIITREISAKIVYEDQKTIAINDISPQAPVHILVIPKSRVETLEEADIETIESCIKTIKKVTQLTGLSKAGYRVVTNIRENGRQSVDHLHFHILGGTKLGHKIA